MNYIGLECMYNYKWNVTLKSKIRIASSNNNWITAKTLWDSPDVNVIRDCLLMLTSQPQPESKPQESWWMAPSSHNNSHLAPVVMERRCRWDTRCIGTSATKYTWHARTFTELSGSLHSNTTSLCGCSDSGLTFYFYVSGSLKTGISLQIFTGMSHAQHKPCD